MPLAYILLLALYWMLISAAAVMAGALVLFAISMGAGWPPPRVFTGGLAAIACAGFVPYAAGRLIRARQNAPAYILLGTAALVVGAILFHQF